MLDWFFPKPPAMARPSILTLLSQLNRPWALRLFGMANMAAALFYGAIATYGLLKKMFPDSVSGPSGDYILADMVSLMERSATHTAIAGAAFAIGFITQAAAIVTARNDPPAAIDAKPPKA